MAGTSVRSLLWRERRHCVKRESFTMEREEEEGCMGELFWQHMKGRELFWFISAFCEESIIPHFLFDETSKRRKSIKLMLIKKNRKTQILLWDPHQFQQFFFLPNYVKLLMGWNAGSTALPNKHLTWKHDVNLYELVFKTRILFNKCELNRNDKIHGS